jgi:Zn-dependent protease with chaperone function
MFGNFIYFIVVLLIYSTYQPSDKTNLDIAEALFLFGLLAALFSALARFEFRRLKKKAAAAGRFAIDYKFSIIQRRLSVLAVILFTINIYGLNLPSFLAGFFILSLFPTLTAVLFLLLFVLYLAVIWYHAHRVHRMLGSTDESRRSFIWSNIAFSIPVLIPWFIISLASDLLTLMPFDAVKHLRNNPAGEMAFFIVFLLAIAVAAPAMIQRFWRCRPLAAGPHRDRIEALCKKAQVTYADILSWPIFGGRMLTAGVMGLVKKFRYILVTDALLNNLSNDEIDSVIAHEIGHVKKHHLQFYLIFFLGFLFLFYSLQDILIFSVSYLNYLMLAAGIFNTVSYPAVYTIFNVVFIILFLLYFRYLFGFFMRNFERQADACVFDLLPSAFPLIASLEKVSLSSGQAPDKPNWHHFSITERIEFLKKCETDRRYIKRHERKLKKGLLAYAVFLTVIAATGWFITPRIPTAQLTNSFLEKLIVLEIEKSPGNATLYFDLANVYLNADKFSEAVTAYKHAIRLKPEFPEALNNLAWLLATCKDEKLRNPEEALRLALAAAKLYPRAHILDTLAESYYVNGKYKPALLTGKQALNLAVENRDYYLKQVHRFQKAMEGVKTKRPEIGAE